MWLPTKRLVAYLCQPGHAREVGGREGGRQVGRETNTDTDTDTDARKQTHHRHKHRGKRKLSAFIGIGLSILPQEQYQKEEEMYYRTTKLYFCPLLVYSQVQENAS